MRVAAGAIAKKYLATLGIQVRGYMSQLGPIEIPFKTWDSVRQNAFFSPDPDKVPELEAYMDQLRRDQDSVGAKITVVAEGVPPGLGEPIFDRLDAELAHALMSINAVKGVEIGAGFASVAQRGTEHRDELTRRAFCPTMPAAFSVASPRASRSSPIWRSSRRPASPRPVAPST